MDEKKNGFQNQSKSIRVSVVFLKNVINQLRIVRVQIYNLRRIHDKMRDILLLKSGCNKENQINKTQQKINTNHQSKQICQNNHSEMKDVTKFIKELLEEIKQLECKENMARECETTLVSSFILENSLFHSKQIQKLQQNSRTQNSVLSSDIFSSNQFHQVEINNILKNPKKQISNINTDYNNEKQTNIQVLHCSNGHQYYCGEIIKGTNIAHGKGRLTFCCEMIPICISGMQNLQKYQGSFKMGIFEGLGTIIYKNGCKITDYFKNGIHSRNSEIL